jgi:hypothetical protein
VGVYLGQYWGGCCSVLAVQGAEAEDEGLKSFRGRNHPTRFR